MTKGITRQANKVLAAIRGVMLVLLLAFSMTVSAPRPAEAAGAMVAQAMCSWLLATVLYAGNYPGCVSNTSTAINTAVSTIVDTFMRSFTTRLELVVGVRTAEAQMNVQKQLAHNERLGENLVNTNSESNAYCAMTTAVGAAGGSSGGGASGGGAAGGPPPAPPRPTVEMRSDGDIAPLPRRLDCGPGTGRSCEQVAQAIAVEAGEAVRTSPDGAAPAAIRLNEQMSEQLPCEGSDAERAACNTARANNPAAPVMYAHVKASTLFGEADAYNGATVEARTQRFNEAVLYCINLITPGAIDRAGGAASADKMLQQASERAGDARISLAYKACADMAARRVGIAFDPNNATYDWIVTAACSYRRAFTRYQDVGTAQLNVRLVQSTLSSSNEGINSLLDANCPATAVLGGSVVDDQTNRSSSINRRDGVQGSGNIHLSRLEMLRIISTDMFASPQFSVANASSSQAELQRMLIAMETVNSQLNMETLRLQEQINLVKSAQLAVDVQVK